MKNVILFCSDHFGALSQCIALTDTYRNSCRIIFLTSTDDKEQIACLEELKRKGVFEYTLYDYRFLCNETEKSVLFNEVVAYFDRILLSLSVELDSVRKIYLCNSGAYTPFGLYLTQKSLNYSVVEFARNEFITRSLENTLSLYPKMSEVYRKSILESGAIVGDTELCTEHIYQIDSNINYNYHGEHIKADFADLLFRLENETKKNISAVFNFDIERFFDYSRTLLLPNSASFTKKAFDTTNHNYIKNPIAPYTLLADLSNITSPLIIKPHPYGCYEFEKYFYDCAVLMKSFPIEFINMYNNIKIQSTLSIETTAAYKIKQKTSELLSIGKEYLWEFKNVLSIWITCMLSFKTDKKIVLLTNSVMEFAKIASFFSKQLHIPLDRNILVRNELFLESEDMVYITMEEDFLPNNNDYQCLFLEKNMNGADGVLFRGTEILYVIGNMDLTKFNETYRLNYSKMEIHITGETNRD